MSHQLRRFSRGVAAAALIAAFVAPTATAARVAGTTPRPLDLRSPDTRDAAAAAEHSARSVDFRSPDTLEAATAPRQADRSSVVGDLRSPDTRDAAAGRSAANATLTIEVVRSSGFDWADAGIGAAAGAGFLLLLAGASLAIRLLVRTEPGAA